MLPRHVDGLFSFHLVGLCCGFVGAGLEMVRFVTNTGALARRILNFRDNAYYVSLSLSAVQGPIVLRNPPAVSVIQFRS
jgi:hypothetical protein